MATTLLPNEASTTTRLFLTKGETDVKENLPVAECKESLEEVKSNLESTSNSDLESKLNLQPCVRLVDITSADSLTKLNAEKLDSRTYIIKTEEDAQSTSGTAQKLSGWYGKGCAKWKKHKKRGSSSKRQKTENEVVDSAS